MRSVKCLTLVALLFASASEAKTAKSALRVGGSIWQESMNSKNAAGEAPMRTESKGLGTEIGRYILMKKNPAWDYFYGFNLGFGILRGKVTAPTATEEIKNQSWLMAGISPGVSRRSSKFSRITFSVPIQYRMIEWAFDEETTLEVTPRSNYSVGGALSFENQVTEKGYIQVMLTRHHQWDFVAWTLSWNHLF